MALSSPTPETPCRRRVIDRDVGIKKGEKNDWTNKKPKLWKIQFENTIFYYFMRVSAMRGTFSRVKIIIISKNHSNSRFLSHSAENLCIWKYTLLSSSLSHFLFDLKLTRGIAQEIPTSSSFNIPLRYANEVYSVVPSRVERVNNTVFRENCKFQTPAHGLPCNLTSHAQIDTELCKLLMPFTTHCPPRPDRRAPWKLIYAHAHARHAHATPRGAASFHMAIVPRGGEGTRVRIKN